MFQILIFLTSFFVIASEQIGTISTTVRVVGRNDRIAIDVFEDPKVSGVACYVSHAQTGGVGGAMGYVEDPTSMSVSCSAVGQVSVTQALPSEPEEVFQYTQSFLFKKLKVMRFVDTKRRVLIYTAVKTRFWSGSSQNNITTVPY